MPSFWPASSCRVPSWWATPKRWTTGTTRTWMPLMSPTDPFPREGLRRPWLVNWIFCKGGTKMGEQTSPTRFFRKNHGTNTWGKNAWNGRSTIRLGLSMDRAEICRTYERPIPMFFTTNARSRCGSRFMSWAAWVFLWLQLWRRDVTHRKFGSFCFKQRGYFKTLYKIAC